MMGTMVLVLMGCGAAVFAGAGQPFDSVGTLGVAFAFGLSVVAMAYAIGSISGLFIVAPLLGAAIAALTWKGITVENDHVVA